MKITHYSIPEHIENQIPSSHELEKAFGGIFPQAPEGEMHISWTDKQTITNLNLTHRKKDTPTDILTFPYGSESDVFADIIICHEVLIEKHGDAYESLTDMYEMILCHGLVHAMGYDHETEKDAQVMESYEKKLLMALGNT